MELHSGGAAPAVTVDAGLLFAFGALGLELDVGDQLAVASFVCCCTS